MAGQLTLWGAGELLRTFFGRSALPPTEFYLALIRQIPPTPYVSGLELDEPPLEAGYSRALIVNDATSWDASGGLLHVVSNALDVAWPPALADWGRIGYWAICASQEGGYVYFVGKMEEEKSVLSGDTALVPADELVVELGPFYTQEDF